jgi:hypothetical protein
MTGKARCYDHRDLNVLPTCQTCRRIGIERHIVLKTARALLDAGYARGEQEFVVSVHELGRDVDVAGSGADGSV